MKGEIEFHADGMSREGNPAINVKLYRMPDIDAPDDILEQAWESVKEAFWEEAIEVAHERGYSSVFSEGRSGGWMLPFYQTLADGRTQFHNWPGQGGGMGYPRYPDVSQIGERSRFLAFQRRIQTMLDSVPDCLREEVSFLLEEVTA